MDANASSWIAPEWIQRFYDDNEDEESDDVPFPIYLIPTEGRNVIWGLTQRLLGTLTHGAASHACQLLERYLAAHLSSLTHLMSSESAEWQQTKQQLKRNMLLIVAICVQLVSKVLSANNRLNGQAIRKHLRKTHFEYTLQQINEAELHVYQTLRFRVPLWTNVDKAQMLAQEVGLSDSSMDCVGIIMDITDYHRVVLQEIVRGVAFVSLSSNSSSSEPAQSPTSIGLSENKIRNMHLVAGAVAAAIYFSQHTGLNADHIRHLAFLTRSPETYITCIRDAIINQVFKDPMSGKRPARKLSPLKSKRQRFC